MKILHKGTVPLSLPAWWVGLEGTCPVCCTGIKLEADDKPALRQAQGRTRDAIIACPTCEEAGRVAHITCRGSSVDVLESFRRGA